MLSISRVWFIVHILEVSYPIVVHVYWGCLFSQLKRAWLLSAVCRRSATRKQGLCLATYGNDVKHVVCVKFCHQQE